MSLQEAKGRESSAPPPPRYLHAIKEAISGPSGAVVLSDVFSNATGSAGASIVGSDTWTNAATTGHFFGRLAGPWGEYYELLTVVQAAVVPAMMRDEQYNPDLVAEILHADAKPPEAKFNNVVDMLDWLNRD